MRTDFIARSSRALVIGALSLTTAATGSSSVAEDPAELPQGVRIETEAGTGTNRVVIQVGGDTIVVDQREIEHQQPDPRFRLETGAVDSTVAGGSATELRPRSRGLTDPTSSSTILFESGFTLGAADRELVFFDLDRNVTASDAAVWLPKERVLITGELCTTNRVTATAATDTAAWISTLETLIDLEPDLVIPWRGEPGGSELLQAQIDRITALRRSIESGLLAGQTAAEINRGLDDPWLMEWRNEDSKAAASAVSAVINEIGGLTTPWELVEDRRLREGASPTRDDEGWTAPKRILWRNRWPDRFPMLAQVAPGVEIIPFDSAEEAMDSIAGADAIIGIATPELLAAGTDLRWAQVGSAGVERYLKIPELGNGRVLLTNGQRLASEVIGEHAMALTRALARGLNRAVAAQVAGKWQRTEIGDRAPLTRLRGKTLLVVGLGGIGTEVARLADAAGMRVIAIRSSRRSGPPFVAKVGLNEDLKTFLVEADVVVNCLPLTPDTEDIFDAELFTTMRETAFFINVGRGGTVDTDALVSALENEVIAGAGIDVTDPEPLPGGHPLWQAPNLIITPHFAAWSDAGREIQWLLFRENLRRFVAGEQLLSVVDPERGY